MQQYKKKKMWEKLLRADVLNRTSSRFSQIIILTAQSDWCSVKVVMLCSRGYQRRETGKRPNMGGCECMTYV